MLLQGPKPGSALQLVYEGKLVRGIRHGQGTSYSSSRSEVFSGQWVDGKRTGRGKQQCQASRTTLTACCPRRCHGCATQLHQTPEACSRAGPVSAAQLSGSSSSFTRHHFLLLAAAVLLTCCRQSDLRGWLNV